MAENKKSFVLYTDLIHTFEELSDKEAGRLVKHLFRYVNDQNPECEDKIVKIAFEPIKRQLKRDLVKYEHKKKLWSDAGKESARIRALNSTKSNEHPTESTDVEVRSTESTVTVNDTVNVNVINKDTAHAEFFEFIKEFNQITGRKFKGIEKEKKQFSARKKDGYALNEILIAVSNCFSDQFHIENPNYLTPGFILRPDKLQKYFDYKLPTYNGKPNTETKPGFSTSTVNAMFGELDKLNTTNGNKVLSITSGSNTDQSTSGDSNKAGGSGTSEEGDDKPFKIA